jgi:hypothetical protein
MSLPGLWLTSIIREWESESLLWFFVKVDVWCMPEWRVGKFKPFIPYNYCNYNKDVEYKLLPLFFTSPLLSSMVKCSANSDNELSMLKRKVWESRRRIFLRLIAAIFFQHSQTQTTRKSRIGEKQEYLTKLQRKQKIS